MMGETDRDSERLAERSNLQRQQRNIGGGAAPWRILLVGDRYRCGKNEVIVDAEYRAIFSYRFV
jgi:hypothetical protein